MNLTLQQTQLYQWHVDHGARMTPFAGWEMPILYPTGPIEEHHITRRSAGLFDIEHMGRIEISGPDAEAYLQKLLTWDVCRLADWQAHYALLCYEHGGVMDDVFIYRLPGRWLLVVNADNLTKDWAWMLEQAADYSVTLTDLSDSTGMMALQGPNAVRLLQHLSDIDLAAIARFWSAEANIADALTLVGRTGYTGEDGFELFFDNKHTVHIWQSILAAGIAHGIEVAPIGLAARDSLRFEPSFPLYGHELGPSITPLEARLGWACSWDQEFIGRAALLAQKEAGLRRKLISFELTERGVPRQGYPVLLDGERVGKVTTGLYAPTVDKYCGNAFVAAEKAKIGREIAIEIRNKPKTAVIVQRPFYRSTY